MDDIRIACPSLFVDIDCTKCGRLVNLPNAVREGYLYLCPQCAKNKDIIDSLTFKEIDVEDKTSEMKEFLNSISKNVFSRSRDEADENKICVMCGEDATKFKDKLSEKEYRISKMCQKCQDKVFGV